MMTFRYAQLVAEGVPDYEVRARLRSGEWRRIRPGGYVAAGELSPEDDHRALIATTVPILASDTVLSHQSAGLLWGLPVPWRLLDRVHVTRPGAAGGNIGTYLHIHRRELTKQHVIDMAGMPVTSMSRTAIDLACQVHRHEALGVIDAALRLGCDPAQLREELARATRCRGVAQARWAVDHGDARSESQGESVSRYWMIVGGVPAPDLQFEIRDERGVLLGRSDFAWPDRRVVGEFDGRVKYEAEFGDQADATRVDAVMAEKRRETNIAFEGWRVIRWGMPDLRNGASFARRLKNYLERRQ